MEESHKQLIEKYTHKMTSIFTPFGEYSQEDIDLITDCGRKIANESYYGNDIGSYGSIISNDLKEKRPDLINGDTIFYFGSCRMAGEYIAKDNPEVIDQTLSGAYRLVKD
ncbi:MAG TPA: hypothetical protein PLX95_02775 [bacterium]|nr:hypothetical protein [bacterium]